MAVTLKVTLSAGTPRRGLWCERCSLPSVVEVDLWMLTSAGMRLVGTHRKCVEVAHGRR